MRGTPPALQIAAELEWQKSFATSRSDPLPVICFPNTTSNVIQVFSAENNIDRLCTSQSKSFPVFEQAGLDNKDAEFSTTLVGRGFSSRNSKVGGFYHMS